MESEEIMLYVFVVSRGELFALEVAHAMRSVGALKLIIEKHFSIGAKNQIMVMNNGTSLDDNAMVCNYGAGAESNPIFLFDSEGFVKEDETKYQVSADFGAQISSLERNPENAYVALDKRAQLALRLFDATRNEFKLTECFSSQVHLLIRSWQAAVNNLKSCVNTFNRQREWQQEEFMRFLNKKEEYTATIHGMSSVLELLLHLPVLEVLRKGRPELPSSMLNWIEFNCKNVIREYTETCHNRLQDLTKERFDAIDKEAVMVVEQASNPQSTGFNVQKIPYLDQAVKELKHHSDTMRVHAYTVVSNRDKANSLKGQLDKDALRTLCESTLGQLYKMKDFEQTFRAGLKLSIERKNKVMETLKNKQSWMFYMQKSMSSIGSRLTVFTEQIRRVERQIEFIGQVRSCAETYLALLVESARRRMFSDQYIEWCNKVYKISWDVCLQERSKRIDFDKKIPQHFLYDIFPGLSDLPGFLAQRPIVKFDEEMPEINHEQIKSLAGKCGKYFTPEMAAELKKSEDNCDVITKLFHKLYHLDDGDDVTGDQEDQEPRQQVPNNSVGGGDAMEHDDSQRSDAPVLLPDADLAAEYVVDGDVATAVAEADAESVLVHVKKDGQARTSSADSDEFHSVSSHSAHSSTEPSEVEDDEEFSAGGRRELGQEEWATKPMVNVDLIEKLQSEKEMMRKNHEATIAQWEQRLKDARHDAETVIVQLDAENKARKLAWSREAVANQQLHDAQEKVRGLKGQLLNKTSEVGDLKSQLAQAANQQQIQLAELATKHDEELAALERTGAKAAAELTGRNDALSRDLEQKSAGLTQAEDRIQELETELSNSELEVRRQREDLSGKDGAIKRLNAQVESMERQREEVILAERRQRADVTTLENKLGVSESRYKDLQQTIGDFEMKIQDNESKIQRYDAMEKGVAEMKAKLARVERSGAALEDEHEQLKRDLREAKEAREEEGRAHRDQLQSERHEHERRLEEEEGRHRAALESVETKYSRKLKEKETDHGIVIKRLHEQRAADGEEMQKAHNAEMDELRTERLELEQRVKTTNDENEQLKGEIADLQKKFCVGNEAVNQAYEDSLRAAQHRESTDQCADCDSRKLRPASSYHLDGKNVQRNQQFIINSALQRLTRTKDEKIEQLQQLLISQSSVMTASTMSVLPAQADESAASASTARGAKEREKMTIVISNFQPDDLVLVVYDAHHRHHVLQTTNTTAKYFIHTESLNELGLSKSDDSRRFARFVEKEYCQAKKPTNRFNVPVGYKFFRVRVSPLLNKRQQQQTTTTTVTSPAAS